MTMLLKLEIVIILTAFISINLAEKSDFKCELDDMKLFVVEACENYFKSLDLTQDNRDKREIWNGKYNINGIGEHKSHHSKYSFDNEMVRVRRKDYPDGGFIRININHAKILTSSDSDYKIYHRKYHNKSSFGGEKQYRHKRNADDKIHMLYCCVNTCRVEYFCRRR